MPWRPSTSQSRTFLPCEASASARDAATVDLPVPPLPVTTCRRTPGQSLTPATLLTGHFFFLSGSRRLPSGLLPFGPLRISQKPSLAGLGLSRVAPTAARVPIWATLPDDLNVILPRLPIR